MTNRVGIAVKAKVGVGMRGVERVKASATVSGGEGEGASGCRNAGSDITGIQQTGVPSNRHSQCPVTFGCTDSRRSWNYLASWG